MLIGFIFAVLILLHFSNRDAYRDVCEQRHGTMVFDGQFNQCVQPLRDSE